MKRMRLSGWIRPGGSMSRMIDSAVTLLPQPDSPTKPSVRPCSSENVTPSTARMTPSLVWNQVRRSSTRSSSATNLKFCAITWVRQRTARSYDRGDGLRLDEFLSEPPVHQLRQQLRGRCDPRRLPPVPEGVIRPVRPGGPREGDHSQRFLRPALGYVALSGAAAGPGRGEHRDAW